MTKTIKGILLDIEGTTSSISFVYDVMFPFIRENLSSYLADNWDTPELKECLPALANDAGQPSVDAWFDASSATPQETIAQFVIQLMDDDVKATGLKQLQGVIWKSGFEQGELVAHLYEEVAPAIQRWNQSGIDVKIYSSGSVQAQKLFFGHTVAGNLLESFSGHYDTKIGSKKEMASYQTIANDFNCEAGEILFVSDVTEELDAAKSAGLQTVLSLRPGNKPQPHDHGFPTIENFDSITVQAV